MPGSPVTRQRTISRDTCVLGFTGNTMRKSYVFDATTLSPDSNGFYYVPAFSFVSRSTSDPTKIKVYQGTGSNVNAIQTLTMTGGPAGGTFTLTYNGQTTAPIAYNASAAVVQAALVLLPNIGAGNVVCAGGALPSTPVTCQFEVLLGNQPITLMSANYTALTGGTTPALTPTTSQVGQTAETIIGVFDNLEYDFFGNAVADDEPVSIYDQFTSFDTTKLVNWMSYGAAAKTALPTCTFQP